MNQRAARRAKGLRLKTAQGARAVQDWRRGWSIMAWASVSMLPRRARAAARAAEGERPAGLLFGGEVGEVVGELGEVAADVAGSDAGAEKTLA